jgi:hypothetical protein
VLRRFAARLPRAYVDPWLAPEDFLVWLSGWSGDDRRGLAARSCQAFIANIAEVTAGEDRRLRAELAIYTGGDVEIKDRAVMVAHPGAMVPGEDVPRLVRGARRRPVGDQPADSRQMITSSAGPRGPCGRIASDDRVIVHG